MNSTFNVFARPERIDITSTQRTVWLPQLERVLRGTDTHISQVLHGSRNRRRRSWCRDDVREIEKAILSYEGDRVAVANFLSILHHSCRLWCADQQQALPLPQFLPPTRTFRNPFTMDYSEAVLGFKRWKRSLSKLIDPKSRSDFSANDADLRIAALVISSILHGGLLGSPSLVALIRAVPLRDRATYLFGRTHIELSLCRRGVRDAEQQTWLPDALSALCWHNLSPTDASEFLRPVDRDGIRHAPDDGTILRRIGRMINRIAAECGGNLVGLHQLRKCVSVVALVPIRPVYVAYCSNQYSSESLPREEVWRLNPTVSLFESSDRTAPNELALEPDQPNEDQRKEQPAWVGQLLSAVRSTSSDEQLTSMATDPEQPQVVRTLADFAAALLVRPSWRGKRLGVKERLTIVRQTARGLGDILGQQNLAAMAPIDRRQVYLQVINQQPAANRRKMVQAIREFDLYLVAKDRATLPVGRKALPCPEQGPSVDANMVTHPEYEQIRRRIEEQWPVLKGERLRTIARLCVILAFRCGLRRSEIRRLRMEDLLILIEHEVQVRSRRGDPLKSLSAERRIPLVALLSEGELQELVKWANRRSHEGATSESYVFNSGLGRLPKGFFDSLNGFIRRVTSFANRGKGLHLHHLRHSAGTNIFVALMHGKSSDRIASLFPSEEAQAWFQHCSWHRIKLVGFDHDSFKHPQITAQVCGHASFDTTASSYIHLFPWLIAACRDDSRVLRPDLELIRIASGLPPTTFRRWLRDAGVQSIAVRLFQRDGFVQSTVPNQGYLDTSTQDDAATWISPAWELLVHRALGEEAPDFRPETLNTFERADWLMAQRTPDGRLRHACQRIGTSLQPDALIEIPVPRQPTHTRNAPSSQLERTLGRLGHERHVLMCDALEIFAAQHERDGFVVFEGLEQVDAASRYVRFLLALGFGKRELELISGDDDQASQRRRHWQEELTIPNLHVRPCGHGRNYGPKTSLWVRPKISALRRLRTGPGGFRFMLAMAFIVLRTAPLRPLLSE